MTDTNRANFVTNAVDGSKAALRWNSDQAESQALESRASKQKAAEADMGKAGSVRTAVIALVLTVISALAVFPFIMPTIPA